MNTESRSPFEVTIEKLVTGGRGLARHEGRALFVPETAPGDRVMVEVTKQAKNFAEARLIEVLEPGPERRAAPCAHYDLCGGCDMQHLSDEAQQAAWNEILSDCFQRLGGIDITDRLDATPDCPVLGYRNRLRLSSHPTGRYGLRQRSSHDVVPIDDCLVMAAPFQQTVLPWLWQLPPVEQIVVRLDGRDGWLLSLYGPPQRLKVLRKMASEWGETAPVTGLQGLHLNNRPIWGRGYLVLHVAGQKYRVSHQSFFQGNLTVAEVAIATVRSWLDEFHPESSDLADLYAGVGLFTLALADRFERVLTVESDPSAALDARENVRRHAVARDRATVRQDDVEFALGLTKAREALTWNEACVVVDPPRVGLGKPVLAALADLKPRTVVYLSCDPATLARDAKVLGESGYEVKRVRLLPMFPQTAHLETLVLLTRQDEAS